MQGKAYRDFGLRGTIAEKSMSTDDMTVEELVNELLKGATPEERLAAAKELAGFAWISVLENTGRNSDQVVAVNALITSFQDEEDRSIREFVVTALKDFCLDGRKEEWDEMGDCRKLDAIFSDQTRPTEERILAIDIYSAVFIHDIDWGGLEPFYTLAHDPNPEIRSHAIAELGCYPKDYLDVGSLIDCLADSVADIGNAARAVIEYREKCLLSTVRDDDIERLVALFTNERAKVRMNAMETLVDVIKADAVHWDPSRTTRTTTLRALEIAAQDPEESVRNAAQAAIVCIRELSKE